MVRWVGYTVPIVLNASDDTVLAESQPETLLDRISQGVWSVCFWLLALLVVTLVWFEHHPEDEQRLEADPHGALEPSRRQPERNELPPEASPPCDGDVNDSTSDYPSRSRDDSLTDADPPCDGDSNDSSSKHPLRNRDGSLTDSDRFYPNWF